MTPDSNWKGKSKGNYVTIKDSINVYFFSLTDLKATASNKMFIIVMLGL